MLTGAETPRIGISVTPFGKRLWGASFGGKFPSAGPPHAAPTIDTRLPSTSSAALTLLPTMVSSSRHLGIFSPRIHSACRAEHRITTATEVLAAVSAILVFVPIDSVVMGTTQAVINTTVTKPEDALQCRKDCPPGRPKLSTAHEVPHRERPIDVLRREQPSAQPPIAVSPTGL